ncbi:unnamed protein product [Schistosoma curassoni]|uniref:MOSC domain-containing protein n=1 Tax=Schistosoma curassoni TaxID=6186 RepID=A0A183K7R3_9TREM|nr:unnamed protein product [Schistosoma curassoni]
MSHLTIRATVYLGTLNARTMAAYAPLGVTGANNELVEARPIVVEGSRQEILDPGFVLFGTRQEGVRVILRRMILPGGFDPVSPSFTVRDVTSELSGPRPTSCRIEM